MVQRHSTWYIAWDELSTDDEVKNQYRTNTQKKYKIVQKTGKIVNLLVEIYLVFISKINIYWLYNALLS